MRRYKAGDTIGGAYRILHVFEDGLGVVYVVEHTTGDRLVLKTLKSVSSHADEFRREAATWVRLGAHPNIVQAQWVDELAGMLCVAAELIEPDEIGRLSLRDYLRLGALTPVQIARYAAHFCYGLEYALSQGLVCHRDIKPENLLIGASGDLKITDFGIATAAAPVAEAQHARLGRWQADGLPVSGTPPYMAPEQIAGSANQDQRTDIYSFGVVLCEMAYGQLPFDGRSASDFFHHHLNTEPRVPHGPFADIVRRCLAKAPGMRYATVSDLLVDFERVCKAQKLFLPPRPVPEDNSLAELRARAHSLGALGRHAEAIASARELVRRAPEDSSAWTQLGRLLLESGDKDSAKSATNRSLALNPTRSVPWNNLGLILAREEKWHEAVEAFDRALDCDPQNTGAMLNAAKPLAILGKVGEAVRRLRRATEIAPDKYLIWAHLGTLHLDLRERNDALECLHKARDLAPACYRAEIEELIRDAEKLPAVPLAGALLARGRTAEEAECQRRLNEAGEHDLQALISYAEALMKESRFSEALQSLTQILQSEPRDSYAWYSYTWYLAGVCCERLSDFEGALNHYDRALHLNANEPDIHAARGNVFQLREQWEEAIKSFRRAIELDPDRELVYAALALTQQKCGQLEKTVHNYNVGLKALSRRLLKTLRNDRSSPIVARRQTTGALWFEHAVWAAMTMGTIDSLAIEEESSEEHGGLYWLDLPLANDKDKIGRVLLPNYLSTFIEMFRRETSYSLILHARGLVLQLLGRQDEARLHIDEAIEFSGGHGPPY